MRTWPQVCIEECAEIVSGATPSTSDPSYWDGDVCWATPKDLGELEGPFISDTPRKITRIGLDSCAAAVLPPHSVLFSSRAPIGHVAINTVPMATNQGFKSFIPRSDRLLAGFLYHWLRSNRSYLESLGNGATFKEVSKAVVSRIQIPLPPLSEQRRIADVLDRAEALRAKRRAALAEVEALPQTLFLEMFGDPCSNPKSWPAGSLKEIGKIKTGRTPPSGKPGMFGGAVPFVTPGDLESGEPVKRTLTDDGAAVTDTVRAGATLVCCIGATIGKMGKAARRSAFNQQLNAVEWAPIMDDDFGLCALQFFKSRIATWGASTTLPILKKSSFEKIEIPVPPIGLQREFSRRVAAVEKLKAAHRSSLAEMDALFASLQHRAFRGEL